MVFGGVGALLEPVRAREAGARVMAALSGGSPFDTPSRKHPALETLGASLREQFVSARALRVCLPPHIYADRHVSVSLGARRAR